MDDFILMYMNGFYDGEKKWKDKIKEKIAELDETLDETKQYWTEEVIDILEELLEK